MKALTPDFESTFEHLLAKANAAHELRVVGADLRTRAAAADELFQARIDAGRARNELTLAV